MGLNSLQGGWLPEVTTWNREVLKLQCRLYNTEDARSMGYLPRKTGDSMWSQLKRKTTTTINNSWKRTMKACPSLNDVIISPEWWSWSCEGWRLSYYSVTQFLPYRMETFTLPHHTVSYTLHLDSYRISPLWDYGKSQNQLCFALFPKTDSHYTASAGLEITL